MFKNLIKFWCGPQTDRFCKSCVHIYFWLVLGKKYHRVFIKQRHLTFDNVTDQVKLTEARLLKDALQKSSSTSYWEGGNETKCRGFGWPCFPPHPPSLVQMESPPPIDLEGHQSSWCSKGKTPPSPNHAEASTMLVMLLFPSRSKGMSPLQLI